MLLISYLSEITTSEVSCSFIQQ